MTENQPTSCCFTGHRYISPEEMKHPQAVLIKTLTDLIRQGVHTFYAGGALGFAGTQPRPC